MAEKLLLGSIMLVSNVLDEVGAVIRAEDFYMTTHAEIFSSAMELHSKSGPVDAELLADALNKRGKLSEVGGVEYLIECLESVPHAAHAVHYAKIISEKSQRRALSFAGTDAIQFASDPVQPIEDSVAKVSDSVSKVMERHAQTEVQDIRTILLDAMERIGSEKRRGLLARYKSLDDVTNGFEPGNLVILAARPSIGKTALCVNFAYNLASEKHPVGFITLEQTKVEIGERLLGIHARIGSDEQRRGLTEAQRDSVLQAAHEMSEWPLIIDEPHRSIAAIEASARLMARKFKIELLIVDYLQMISCQDRRDVREQEVAEVSRRLKWLAKMLNVPVIALAQLNRQNENRTDRRPRLSDLRESGSIEADADIVILLHRDEFYDPELNPGEAVAIVAKNRNGRTGDVKLHFDKRLMLFRDLAPEYTRQSPSFQWSDETFSEYQ